MDKVVHFELPADDLARMKTFYQSTFGWQLVDMPQMKYVLAHTVAVDERTQMPKEPGAINGGMSTRTAMLSGPSFSIHVADIDAALRKITAAGGAQVKGKVAVGTMGFVAYFKDTEGNILSLWQSLK